MTAPLVVFLRGADWEARWIATGAALSAAALGHPVTLALFGGALRAFVEGRFDEGAPPAAASIGAAGLRDALSEARSALGLRVVACETAARLAGLDPARCAPPLDALVPLTDLVRIAAAGASLSF
jgi:predicted peroxiredoxin